MSKARILACAAALLGTAAAMAGGVAIVGMTVTDDGDHDGFADAQSILSFRSCAMPKACACEEQVARAADLECVHDDERRRLRGRTGASLGG
jgi:hypothetical protein